MKTLLAPALLVVLATGQPVLAQDTRTEKLVQERAQKAAQLQPYKPGKIETILLNAEEGKLRRLISPHNGFFVEYGYTYKPTGSGIGFSGGYRHDLFDRQARVELQAGATLRRYHMIRADFSLPRLFDERLELGVEAVNHRHPQEDFYGLGPASIEDDRVSYLFRGTEINGRAIVTPRDWLHLGTRVGHLNPELDRGRDSRFPSIEERFDGSGAPGLLEQPTYLVTDVFAEIDYRDEPGNARAGGRYRLTLRRHSDRDLDRYSFRTTDLLFQQFVPIFDKKRVFAFQLGIIGTNADTGQEVPFYFRPTLGGGHTLRSVSDYRFRDGSVGWVNVEYRWEAFSPLDMALFTDWGTVGPEIGDLDFGDLKRAYGIGFRFHTPKAVFFRADFAAGGGEGLHMFFKFSKAF